MKRLLLHLMVFFLVSQSGSIAQLINGRYGYWNDNVFTAEVSILTPAGVFGSIKAPGCGDVPNMVDSIRQNGTYSFQIIYQHYGKVNKNPLGYKSLIAKNSFTGSAPAWRLQGACTLAFMFETQALKHSNEGRRSYNKAYESTDYIVVFNDGVTTRRYTFAAP